jgi:hypothetical protein
MLNGASAPVTTTWSLSSLSMLDTRYLRIVFAILLVHSNLFAHQC